MRWRGSPGKRLWRIEVKREDCWLGVFWRRDGYGVLDAWVCLVPMIPLHLRVWP
jgi:DMSO/TMAO reductase YedYZ molybdopterin-dependent catalytic subunit